MDQQERSRGRVIAASVLGIGAAAFGAYELLTSDGGQPAQIESTSQQNETAVITNAAGGETLSCLADMVVPRGSEYWVANAKGRLYQTSFGAKGTRSELHLAGGEGRKIDDIQVCETKEKLNGAKTFVKLSR